MGNCNTTPSVEEKTTSSATANKQAGTAAATAEKNTPVVESKKAEVNTTETKTGAQSSNTVVTSNSPITQEELKNEVEENKEEVSSSDKPRIVVVGCSFFGITATQHLGVLAEEDLAEVIVIDKNDAFYLGATYQYAITGRLEIEDTKFALGKAKFSPKVITRFNTTVSELNLEAKIIKVVPNEGEEEEIKFDYILLAPGAQMYPERVDGLSEHVIDICNASSPEKLKERFNAIESGTIVIAISAVPYKCPPAPFEYAFLLDEILTKRGVREACRIVITCPKAPFPFGNEKAKEVFLAACADKKIEFLAPWAPTQVSKEGETISIKYKSVPPPGSPPPEDFVPETMDLTCDLAFGTFPHGAPKFTENLWNPKGFIPVDILTMETKHAGVYCMGDASWMMLPSKPPKPHPKAGAFAVTCSKNAATMVERLVRGESLETARAAVDKTRKAFCFAESGFDTGIMIGPKLLPDDDGPPGFVVDPPSAESYGKKREWLRDVLSQFFGDEVGNGWAEKVIASKE